MKRILLILIAIVMQLIVFSAPDSLSYLSINDFLKTVAANHPTAKQAEIAVEKGIASVLQARGSFDPAIAGSTEQKQFNDKNYYQYTNAEIKIPTWYGIELKTGIDNSSGIEINPERSVPDAGLLYSGIALPIGQNLFIDQRRAALRQAKLYKAMTEAEQQLILNKLLYDAAVDYWNWFNDWNAVAILQNTLLVSKDRYEAIKLNALLGDRPSIDTIEAAIQLQNIEMRLTQATVELQNSKLQLETHLWDSNLQPLELGIGIAPPAYNQEILISSYPTVINFNIDSVVINHPELKTYELKINDLLIEKKLKQEQLKPIVNINYNFITEAIGSNPLADYNTSNYKIGANFYMPLFLRKERGSLKLTRLKLREANLNLSFKNLEIKNKVLSNINQYQSLNDQIKLATQTVENQTILFNSEKEMFNLGESSLFLVNTRESNYINAQLKMVELITKSRKSYAATLYASAINN
ncbi:MAG: hypothetical protein RIQ89_2 [Bacteroidota bacterium]